MSKETDNIINIGSTIRDESKEAANTATRVGGVIVQIGQVLNSIFSKFDNVDPAGKVALDRLDSLTIMPLYNAGKPLVKSLYNVTYNNSQHEVCVGLLFIFSDKTIAKNTQELHTHINIDAQGRLTTTQDFNRIHVYSRSYDSYSKQWTAWKEVVQESSGGGSTTSGVISVNGKTGAVTLYGSDIKSTFRDNFQDLDNIFIDIAKEFDEVKLPVEEGRNGCMTPSLLEEMRRRLLYFRNFVDNVSYIHGYIADPLESIVYDRTHHRFLLCNGNPFSPAYYDVVPEAYGSGLPVEGMIYAKGDELYVGVKTDSYVDLKKISSSAGGPPSGVITVNGKGGSAPVLTGADINAMYDSSPYTINRIFEIVAAEIASKQPKGDYALKTWVNEQISNIKPGGGPPSGVITVNGKGGSAPVLTGADINAMYGSSPYTINRIFEIVAAEIASKQPKGDYALKSWVNEQIAANMNGASVDDVRKAVNNKTTLTATRPVVDGIITTAITLEGNSVNLSQRAVGDGVFWSEAHHTFVYKFKSGGSYKYYNNWSGIADRNANGYVVADAKEKYIPLLNIFLYQGRPYTIESRMEYVESVGDMAYVRKFVPFQTIGGNVSSSVADNSYLLPFKVFPAKDPRMTLVSVNNQIISQFWQGYSALFQIDIVHKKAEQLEPFGEVVADGVVIFLRSNNRVSRLVDRQGPKSGPKKSYSRNKYTEYMRNMHDESLNIMSFENLESEVRQDLTDKPYPLPLYEMISTAEMGVETWYTNWIKAHPGKKAPQKMPNIFDSTSFSVLRWSPTCNVKANKASEFYGVRKVALCRKLAYKTSNGKIRAIYGQKIFGTLSLQRGNGNTATGNVYLRFTPEKNQLP